MWKWLGRISPKFAFSFGRLPSGYLKYPFGQSWDMESADRDVRLRKMAAVRAHLVMNA
jgi:hypothetical protein